jgi:hypothetical protein
MAGQATSQMDKRPSLPTSPFCSDPNCKYCKDLRLAQEQLRQGKSLVARNNSA